MAEHYKPSYGAWAGNTAGHKPDLSRCCVEIADTSTRFTRYRQCTRKHGFGPDGAYCKQHDPEAVARRKAEVEKRDAERYLKQRLEWAGPRFFAVLKQIADGHNDPRTIALEAIASYLPKEARDA